jgi:uncharacterized membrane protein YagU involved in acid resistance
MSTALRSLATAALFGGLIAGTIDIGAASLIYWLSPLSILRGIASGLIGKAAFNGGVATALLGLLLQWAMSILIAAIYLAVTAVRTSMRTRWRLMGACAGVVIFLVMNYLVVPLSAAPFKPHFSIEGLLSAFRPYDFVASLLAMIVFGLIISFCARDTPAIQLEEVTPDSVA